MIFRILGKKGDTVLDYDLETAEVKFTELQETGLVPFAEDKKTKKLAIVEKFRPEIEEIKWFRKLVGG